MLNLQDKPVCALLPYLLTAYVFNSWRNRFFIGKMKLIPLVCDEDSTLLDSIKVSRMIPSAKSLAQVFSLKSSNKPLLLPDIEAGADERPIPWYAAFYQMNPQSVESPYIKYKEMLDHVYDSWCGVVCECAPLAEIEGFPSDIDWDACKKLYSSYTTGSGN